MHRYYDKTTLADRQMVDNVARIESSALDGEGEPVRQRDIDAIDSPV